MLILPTATVELDELSLRRDGEAHSLTPQEAELLRYLALHDRTVSREELLQQVWGYAPSVVSRAVDATVSRLRIKLEPDPSEPQSLLSVRGKGYRLVQLEALEGPTTLLGRSLERRELRRLVAQRGGVQLVGRGGCGKTALARDLAVGRAVLWADLASCETLDEALRALASAAELAVDERASMALHERVIEGLRGGDDLVVLDNLEQLDDAGQLVEWVREAGRRVVLTSRRPVHEELPVLTLGSLRGQPARELLLRAARRMSAGWGGDDEALDAASDCVDGLPLALELIGAQLPLLPVTELTRDLARVLALGDGRRGRHATLAASLQWSWDRMDEALRRHLRWWACFEGPLPPDALVAVSGPGAEAALRQVTQAGWIDTRADVPRLFPAIRAFCAQRLEESGERQTAERAHGAWLVREVPWAADRWDGEEHDSLRARARELRPDILAAVRRVDEPRCVAELGLVLLHLERGGAPEGAALADRVVEAAGRCGDEELQLEAVLSGLMLSKRGRDAAVDAERLRQADELAATFTAPPVTMARLERLRSNHLRAGGRLEEALAASRAGRRWAERARLPWVCALIDHAEGACLQRLMRLDEAHDCFLRCVVGAQASGDHSLACLAYQALSGVERDRHRPDRAMQFGVRAVAAGRQGDDPYALGGALTSLANAHFAEGRAEQALALNREATALLRRGGYLTPLTVALGNLGITAAYLGDTIEGELVLLDALAVANRAGVPLAAAVWRFGLGGMRHLQGRTADALATYRQAIEELTACGAHARALHARCFGAVALAQLGERDEGLRWLARAEGLIEGSLDDRATYALAGDILRLLAGETSTDPLADHPHDEAWVADQPTLHTIWTLREQVRRRPS